MATRTNLCPNPAAKNDGGGWSGPTGAGRTTGVTGMSRDTGFLTPGPDTAPPRVAVTAGLAYVFSAEVKGQSGASAGTCNINWYAAGGYLSSSPAQAWSVDAGGVVRVSSGAATAPATADEAVLTVEGIDAVAVVTAVLYEQTTVLGSYFDGDTAGAEWTGADGASPSIIEVDDTGGGGSSDEAGVTQGWGDPLIIENFDNLSQWGLYDGAGHAGNGTRDPERISVADGIMTMEGTAGGSTGGMAHNHNQQYGRWEFRARWDAQPGATGNPYHPVLIVWPESDLWPDDGEYDLVENYIGDTVPEAWIHYPHPNLPVEQEHGVYDGTLDMTQWHNWAIDWQPDGITGYCDGVEWYHFADGGGPNGRSDIQDMPSGHATIQLDNFYGPTGMQSAFIQVDWMKVYTHTSSGTPVTPDPPVVDAGADVGGFTVGGTLTRVASETSDATVTARSWTVVSGPAQVGAILSSSTALSWAPTTVGTYVLRYTATSSAGTDTDDITVTVVAAVISGGVPILRDRLPDARVSVEVAWGADVSELTDAAASGWTWSEVTDDVLVADGAQIVMSCGAQDEAAQTQPAEMSVLLDNRSGRYSIGGQSELWPHVRRGVPVRVRVALAADDPAITLFQGYASGWPPSWDPTGRYAAVRLSASGVMRRMLQNDAPTISTFRRVLEGAANLVAYWPCEDGEDAQYIVEGFDGEPMTFTGRPGFGASSVFACSQPLPTAKISTWRGPVRTYAATGQVQLRWLMDVPADGVNATVAEIACTGSTTRWTVSLNTDGVVIVRAYSSLDLIFEQSIGFGINGRRGQFGLQLDQRTASTIHWDVDFIEVGAAYAGGFGLDMAGSWTFGSVTQVSMHTDTDKESNLVLGHVALYSEITDETENARQLAAFDGEGTTNAGARLERVAAENRMQVTILGDPASGLATQPVDSMGPQRPDTLLTLFRDVEGVDGGILHDGRSVGLTYTTRRRRMNRPPGLVLDAAAGEVSFDPAYDDQNIRNRVTATRKGGGEATAEDSYGPLGTRTIGTYDAAVTVAVASESLLEDMARWQVHMGTVDGYRHPQLHLDLARDPGLAASWLAMQLGERIDITNITSVRSQHPAGTVALGLLGWTQSIDQFRWDVVANTAPYEPWRVATLAEPAGDTSEYLLRAGPIEGQTKLAASAAAGATSLSVATLLGPLWTTDADDFPVVVEVAGVPVTVTAVAGGSSPQTFTVAPVSKDLPSGSVVSLWRPTVLAI